MHGGAGDLNLLLIALGEFRARAIRIDGETEAFDQQTLTIADIVATIKFIVALHEGRETIAMPAGETLVVAMDNCKRGVSSSRSMSMSGS